MTQQDDSLGRRRGKADKGLVWGVEVLFLFNEFFKVKINKSYSNGKEMLFVIEYLFLHETLPAVILLSKF